MENKDKWGLNTGFENLTYRQCRDAVVLLYFLNEYKDKELAFEKLKANWTNIVYRLPKTSEKHYNSVKNGRYKVFNRMMKMFDEYFIEL